MKKNNFILNADDFSMSEEIDNACIELIKKKVLNSISLLAVKNIKKKNIDIFIKHKISTGLHFNLTFGKSSYFKKKSSITDDNGNLYSLKFFLIKYFFGFIKTNDLIREIIAQVKFLKKNNLNLSHIDSHQHLHFLPSIWNLVNKVAMKKKIKRIRCPFEKIYYFDSFRVIIKKLIFLILYKINHKYIEINYPIFMGHTLQNKFDFKKIYFFYLKKIQMPNYEIMVHPSMSFQEKNNQDLKFGRLREYTFLKNLYYEP